MTEIKEILLRAAKEEFVRSISRTLSMHRDTINKYISISLDLGVDPTKDAITDELVEKIKSTVTTETKPLSIPRDDILLPHIERIEDYLEKGLKSSKILILLKRDGIEVGDSSFYRFVNSRCENYIRKNITVRLPETDPGHYSQADFGYMGLIWDEEAGRLRKTHALIITLCHSRHMYVYLTFAQDIRAVIEGFEAAWGYFEGISIIVIIDNLKPAIDKSDRYSPKINRQFLEYAQSRGFIVDPANSGHPKGKPIIERAVPYVRDNFFKGENFISIGDGRERAVDWCSNIAGLRVHGTTQKIPAQVFESVEKAALKPYTGERYDIPCWAVCKVHPDHHIRFKNSLYSLPTKYISKTLEVKGDSALVKIYFKGSLVKIHERMESGKRSTDFDDYPKELAPYTLRNPKYQISEGYRRANEIGAFIEEILTGPYPWHRLRSAQKILRLSDKYGADRMAKALTKAKAYSIYDMRRIENMLKNNVEDMLPDKEYQEQLKLDDPRFLRDCKSFNHYK
ncbi:MAG: IS21 family transposase [Actinobacteria bacterium]|nr:IS21 family transposase [Actinomycetota bacterium]